ncbi:MAG TPA: CNNM domain-containing protein, partial [Stellaceae bacterium]|nr:CNNM domain-containing protein [Stellaceae bacterium]
MSTADWVTLAAVVVCLLAAFFFSGSETALTASSRATMLRLAKDGDAKAGIVNRLLQEREELIGALLIGNNVATIAASTLATGLMLEWFGAGGVLAATVVMTILVIVFCEVLPKTAAIDAPDRFAMTVARPI